MKRIVILMLLMAVSWQLVAQRHVIPAGAPGYMFVPPPGTDSVTIMPSMSHYGSTEVGFVGNAFRPGHAVTVYGVAVSINNIEKFPYFWLYMLQDRLVDSTNLCYSKDTLAAELFCFVEQPPVSYASFRFVSTLPFQDWDTLVIPFYEFYFKDPIQVPADRRFYVGASHSIYNVYNHIRKDCVYWPYYGYSGPRWFGYNMHNSQDTSCYFDGLDSTWGLNDFYYPELLTEWACDRCHLMTNDPGIFRGPGGHKYLSRGFFPIIRPPEDNSRIFPAHEHPLRAGAVEGFRLTELDSAHASFGWDTVPPSDWGPVGVNVDAYQVNYAPYMQEYEESDTIVVTADHCTLHMDFDTTVMYKARCRARSHHACDIHDTVVWGDWSREVYFHTGVGVPDTVPLPRMCQRVEGLRYEGAASGWPRFKWERCEGQDLFEVQYAPAGSGDWRTEATISSTECYLFASIDPRMRYEVRVRAHCSHHCHIHDTLLMGGWSDTVEFCLQQEGVDEAAATEGEGLFALTPNPARGTVTVRSTMEGGEYPALLTVNDTKGSEVMRRALTDDTPQTLDLSALPSGSYLVTLTTRSRKTETQRLVVE